MDSQKFVSPYAKLYSISFKYRWENKEWRETLIKEIKSNNPDAKITNKAIIEQYFKRYMMIQPSDKTNIIVNHPGLL